MVTIARRLQGLFEAPVTLPQYAATGHHTSKQKVIPHFVPTQNRLLVLFIALMADFVAEEDIVGLSPSTEVDEPQRHVRVALECTNSCAQDDVAYHQVQFVDKTMRQQVVPEGTAPRDNDIFARLAFEFCNLSVCVCAPDDAGMGDRLLFGQCVRDDDGL
jgi:hypothetical protein